MHYDFVFEMIDSADTLFRQNLTLVGNVAVENLQDKLPVKHQNLVAQSIYRRGQPSFRLKKRSHTFFQ